MLPKIETKLFNNDFYEIKGIKDTNFNINYVDLQGTLNSIPTSTYQGLPLYQHMSQSLNNMQTLTVYSKNIKLKQLFIEIDPLINFIDSNFLICQQIKYEIDKEFFKLVTNLGTQHRDIDLKFDLTDRQLDKSTDKYELIIARLMNASNYIATQGRIGPGQWIVSNGKNYNSILNHIKNINLLYKNNNLIIRDKPFIINDLIDDDAIIIGRKNKIDQPGVHCFLLTDENDNIIFTEILNPMSYKKTLIVQYAIESIGNQSYLQYFRINTKDISYYRYKKLQKIKDLYGL